MSTRIKRTLAFSLAPGASVTLPHQLNNGTIPVTPDIIFIPTDDLNVVSVDQFLITLSNPTGVALAGAILLEWWHTIERAFGDAADLDLTTKPFIVVGSEIGNSPFQPAWGGIVDVVIFANAAGNDTTGNGSALTPYRTLQRAARDVPTDIPPGVYYTIDVSDLGIETIPDDYVLPAWKSGSPFKFPLIDPVVDYQGPICIRATPKLADADATRVTIDVADMLGVPITDPVTGQSSIKLTGPAAAAKAWGVDEWKGKLLFGSAVGEASVVSSNVADEIFFTGGGTPTLPATVLEPSAILECRQGSPSFGGGFNVDNVDIMTLAGLEIRPDDGSSLALVTFAGWLSINSCVLTNFGFQNTTRTIQTGNCVLNGGFCESQILVAGGLVKDDIFGGVFFGRAANEQFVAIFSVFEAGNDIEFGQVPAFFGLAVTNLFMFGCVVRNSGGNGLHAGPGSYAIGNSLFNDNGGSGILANQGAFVSLTGCAGTGNANYGLEVSDGAFVQQDIANAGDLTGTGGDVKVGDLAVAAWPQVQRYDITAVGAGGATGTGSRVYQ